MENTTTINGREYKVSAIETPALTSANATANLLRAYGKTSFPKAEYDASEAADLAFENALEAQFGNRNRWRAVREFNSRTFEAYTAKMDADLLLHKAMNRR